VLTREQEGLSRVSRFAVGQLRLHIYVAREILRGRYQQRAAALTFATLLAVVPLVTVGFSLFKAFAGLERQQIESRVRRALFAFVLGTPEQSRPDTSRAKKLVLRLRAAPVPLSLLGARKDEQTGKDRATGFVMWTFAPVAVSADSAGAEADLWSTRIGNEITRLSTRASSAEISVVGALLLIVTSVLLFSNIENSFNEIWHVTQRRSFLVKFAAFCTILMLGPPLVGASFFLTARLEPLRRTLAQMPGGNYVARSCLRALPLIITWVAFFLAYRLLPKTHVRWRCALAGAIVAGTLWEAAKWGFGVYVAGAVSYSHIYGSLASFPIFLLWLYISWVIVLFGAGVAYTSQNLRVLTRQRRHATRQQPVTEYLALLVMVHIAGKFVRNEGPMPLSELVEITDASDEELDAVLAHLIDAGFVSAVEGEERLYQPARPADAIGVGEVMQRMREANAAIHAPDAAEFPAMQELMARLCLAEADRVRDATFGDLLRKPDSAPVNPREMSK